MGPGPLKGYPVPTLGDPRGSRSGFVPIGKGVARVRPLSFAEPPGSGFRADGLTVRAVRGLDGNEGMEVPREGAIAPDHLDPEQARRDRGLVFASPRGRSDLRREQKGGC